jgi:GntR family transcriptional regulator / MocR family aminotransferase
MVDRLAAAKSVMRGHRPLLEQAVLCDFITDGHVGRHLRGCARSTPSVWACCSSAQRVTAAAAARGVELLALSTYTLRADPPDGLLLGFAAIHPRDFRRGVRALAEVLRA